MSERPRLLLVEDDPELVGMLAALFDEEGYRLDLATDGQRALHLGLTREYDVLLAMLISGGIGLLLAGAAGAWPGAAPPVHSPARSLCNGDLSATPATSCAPH